MPPTTRSKKRSRRSHHTKRSSKRHKTEPLLVPDPTKYVVFPIKYHDIWKSYKTHVNSKWTAEELQEKISRDLTDWNKLDADEQHFIKTVLAFLQQVMGLYLKILQKTLQKRYSGQKPKLSMHFRIGLSLFILKLTVC